MSRPLDIFQIPGQFLLSALLKFLEIPVWKLTPELGYIFALLISLIFWSWLLGRIVIPVIKRCFGFDSQRGR